VIRSQVRGPGVGVPVRSCLAFDVRTREVSLVRIMLESIDVMPDLVEQRSVELCGSNGVSGTFNPPSLTFTRDAVPVCTQAFELALVLWAIR
jgi:hypothetical protein